MGKRNKSEKVGAMGWAVADRLEHDFFRFSHKGEYINEYASERRQEGCMLWMQVDA